MWASTVTLDRIRYHFNTSHGMCLASKKCRFEFYVIVIFEFITWSRNLLIPHTLQLQFTTVCNVLQWALWTWEWIRSCYVDVSMDTEQSREPNGNAPSHVTSWCIISSCCSCNIDIHSTVLCRISIPTHVKERVLSADFYMNFIQMLSFHISQKWRREGYGFGWWDAFKF